ncbi:uncharacterized protein (TIGR03083 family) [Saccharopolyspora erythraea NRRL 2338]|uniref:Uncharacterized protein n=2 Tax=Saccharopolyspora erythraea TaxID=1836 RepID=A4F9B3_SACEN|nr:maleylpyruvate isomerase N-terminal domain-containing protein [Saccharopolyspora erythraea]EQD86581.1 hypothetical protein N599_08955 [Saccharopolyspora erythraea D]PFG94426.1 uncharacterized protein (TIGR03083 family) [Saccharopolyspora erythraea NRRL 2338]QRK91187.1 maleylpyruvate isomerase N-terminal domain-containing protein [Saccharopolyspora erythraea]CAM00638.1 hypothetical protein SACE_1315 [Saccharopolyspora erythraea NRRL 2338]
MIVDELEQAWRGWADLGSALGDEQWRTPTRLDGWAVRDVFAHCAPAIGAAGAAWNAPPAEAPVTHSDDAAELLRFFQQPGGVAHEHAGDIRDQAVAKAAAAPAEELLEAFTVTAPKLIAKMRETPLDHRIDYIGVAVLSAREVMRILLMEAVVHYVDMATALDMPVPGPVAGAPLRTIAHLLTDLADPVAFIDAATGRSKTPVLPVLR